MLLRWACTFIFSVTLGVWLAIWVRVWTNTATQPEQFWKEALLLLMVAAGSVAFPRPQPK
jgi:hypothetical protein